ncbi:MAG: glycosyltransferase family 39 protein [Patescibacteria group bacterium]
MSKMVQLLTKPKAEVVILLVCLLIISFLRLVRLDSVPPGFANDEAAITYQAYSVLKTGKDTWGNKYPLLSFRDFGEHLPPFAVYAQIPFIKLFGLNTFAARLPFAISSIISLAPLYFLTRRLFKKKEIALVACILFTISPLNIGWSRFVYEGNFGMLFYLLGLTFYTFSSTKPKLLILSLISFGVTFTTYHIYYLITPLTIFLLSLPKLLPLLRDNRKLLTILVLLLALIGTYYVLITGSGAGRERFRQVSIFNNPDIIQQLNEKRSYCDKYFFNPFCKIVFNKPTAFFTEYSYNYLFHLSPTFLAINGSFLRGAILPIHGLIYPYELLFFYIGCLSLFVKRNQTSYILLAWLTLYPIANSFTGVGEISRITHVMPLFPIIIASGIYSSFSYIKKHTYRYPVIICFSLIAIFNIASFLINYFYIFPYTNYKNGEGAYVELFKRLSTQDLKGKRVFITRDYLGSSPEFQARIFLPIDPEAFQDDARSDYVIKKPQNYIDYERVDNYYFGLDKIDLMTKNDILIVSKNELKISDKLIFSIREPSGEETLFAVKRNLYEK